jgi:hypothetical protein
MLRESTMGRVDLTGVRRVAARAVPGLCKLLPLLFVACLARAEQGSSAMAACPPGESSKFICGVVNSEDIVQLPKSHWVVTSGKIGPGVPVGHLFLVNVDTRVVETLYPVAHNQYRQDQKLFSSCPGKPDEKKFHAEGINVRATDNGKYTLYVINHGGKHDFVNEEARESTEVFEIDTRDDKPKITWVGCALSPPMPDSHQPSVGNAVAPLPNDAFAVTINPAEALAHMRDPETAAKLLKGEILGRVMIWSPGTGWQEVPGSEMAGNNGIEASPDGKWLYVDALLERGIYRLSLGRTPVERVVVRTTFYPDNIRWGDDGFLYVAGPAATSRGIFGEAIACQASPSCPSPFKVLRLDPQTLHSEELLDEPGGPLFGLATGVAKVGNELWVSSVRGTRLAVFPIK